MQRPDESISVGTVAIAAAVVTAAVGAPIAGVGFNNYFNFVRDIQKIDSGASVFFTSVDQCVSKELAKSDCVASFEAAKSHEGKFGVPDTRYDNYAHCIQKHDSCDVGARHFVNPKVPSSGRTDIYFTPAMIGWQASSKDFTASVPIYAGKNGVAIRQDGKQFNSLRF